MVLHGLRTAHSRWSPPVRTGRPMFDVRSFEPNNVAHLLLEILPLCLFVREVLGEEAQYVFGKVHGPFRDLIDLFRLDALVTHRQVAGDMVRVRGTRGLAAYDLLGLFDCPAITFFPHVYDSWSFSPPHRSEKLFLARRGPRALVNQAEVEAFLARRGFETVYMEDYPVSEQLGLASQARHVVGVHGAAMASLVLNPALDSVVELLPPHVYHQFYPVCLDARVRRYALLLPEFDETVVHSGWPTLQAYKNEPFQVDMPSLERALSEAGA